MAIHTYAPGSGKMVQSDNDVVNLADGINPDGSLNVVDNGALLGTLVAGGPFTISGASGHHNPQSIAIPSPTLKSAGGRYLVIVKNGIASELTVTVGHVEAAENYDITSFTVGAGKRQAFIVQGWLLGAGVLVIDPAASGTGTVTVTIRAC